ncbi:MAG TPA: heme exporter protein CcmB [Solirubrobacterales bacterium]|jgi:heme exporter protein B|nr:heme exporter protein CcmB [Solirubrobacterales bacterium]
MSEPRQGPGVFTAAAAILKKDLRLELRTLESLTATTIFTVATFIIFHFALQRDELDGSLASGVFWVTILFASALAINRLLSNERQQGGYESLLLAPIDRNAILFAKFALLFITLTVTEIIAFASFALLLLGPSPAGAFPELIPILLLANAGIAGIGTLVAALATDTSARELLVPLMTLPLFTPLLIGAARATAPLFEKAGDPDQLGRWLGLIGLYDSVFLLLAFALFDFILDD